MQFAEGQKGHRHSTDGDARMPVLETENGSLGHSHAHGEIRYRHASFLPRNPNVPTELSERSLDGWWIGPLPHNEEDF